MEVQESSKLTDGATFPIKFRNYLPYDRDLQQFSTSFKDVSVQESKETDESSIRKAAEARVKRSPIQQELDSLSSDSLHLVPRKPNSDLKKQVEERLKKLNKRTERALVDMLREKLKREASMEE
jgi:coiled-coil domain-containing protein 12